MSIELSTKQKDIFLDIMGFFLNNNERQFVFSGLAGAGKTTLIKYVNDELSKLSYTFRNLTITGKASQVLMSKGIASASTIHSFLYMAEFDELGELVGFRKKTYHEMEDVDFIIIDEASMVSYAIYQDLLATKKKILFVGDEFQLPAIDK